MKKNKYSYLAALNPSTHPPCLITAAASAFAFKIFPFAWKIISHQLN
jgi:hypothetical protein